jgi:hypothetical protein
LCIQHADGQAGHSSSDAAGRRIGDGARAARVSPVHQISAALIHAHGGVS